VVVFGVTPVTTLGFFGVVFVVAVLVVVVFVVAVFFVAVDVLDADVLVAVDFEPLEPEVLVFEDGFCGVDTVAVAVGGGAVVVWAVVLDGLSLPQPENTMAITTTVVAVSLRGTARTISPGRSAMRRT
jgi:hypothetical protein